MTTETPWKMTRGDFNFEETLLATPKPQACSTVDKKGELKGGRAGVGDLPGAIEAEEGEGRFLDDGMEALAEMKDRLARAGLRLSSQPVDPLPPSSVDSSSLGLLHDGDLIDMNLADTTELLSSLRLREDEGDVERRREARQRALQALNLTNTSIVPDKIPPAKKTSSVVSLPDLGPLTDFNDKENALDDTALHMVSQLPVSRANSEMSGFSEILTGSQLAKEEEEWQKEWGNLPIEPRDISLSGYLVGEPSINFMPLDDSFLKSLGPTDPPKAEKRRVRSETVTLEESYEEGLRSYLGETRLERLGSEVSVPSLEEIADALRKLPSNATPRTLMDNVLNSTRRNDSSTVSIDSSNAASSFIYDAGNNGRSTLLLDSSSSSNEGSVILVEDEIYEPSSLTTSAVVDNRSVSTVNSFTKKKGASGIGSFQTQSMSSTDVISDNVVRYERWGVVGCGLQVPLETSVACQVKHYDPTNLMVHLVKGYDDKLRAVVMPLVVGKLSVLVNETTQKGVLHHIVIQVEEPYLEIVSERELNFGLLPDRCYTTKVLDLKSNNKALLSIRYTLRQEVDGVFQVVEDPDQPGCEMFLAPGDSLRRTIAVSVPSTGEEQRRVRGELELSINLSEKFMAKRVVAILPLTVDCVRTRLMVVNKGVVTTHVPGQSSQLQLVNGSVCPLQLMVKAEGAGFSVQPPNLLLQPSSKAVISIAYLPYDPTVPSEGLLYIKVVPDGQVFRLVLRGSAHVIQPPLSPSGSSSSLRSDTPTSINESTEIRPLELDCTKTHLVWSGVSLNTKQERTCVLRNRSNRREKLSFTMNDPTHSYMFVKDGELRKEMRLSLDGLQKKEFTVCLWPKAQGQLRATVVITRVNSDLHKKTIGLLGFGGEGRLQVDGVTLDLDSEVKRLVLDPQSLTTSFSLHNTGDAPSYFYIDQPCVEGTLVEIRPRGGLVDPGSVERVVVRLRPSAAAGLDEALRGKGSAEARLSSLTVVHGDQPTRLRLLRLYRKHGKDCPDEKLKPIMKNLAEMLALFPTDGQESVSTLKDPLNSLCWLYQEGVREWHIDVVVSRAALEAAALDLTQQFLMLDNTITDETLVSQSVLQMSAREHQIPSSVIANREMVFQHLRNNKGVTCESNRIVFPETNVGRTSSAKIRLYNFNDESVYVSIRFSYGLRHGKSGLRSSEVSCRLPPKKHINYSQHRYTTC